MARLQLVVALAALLALCAFAAAAQPVIPNGRRNQAASCKDDKTGKQTCYEVPCPKECPYDCAIQCSTCKAYCLCGPTSKFPGASACGDPQFVGADGNNFYFHGKKDQDFCIVSDADLHINAHFIGKRNPAMSRDFTWIQALGVRFTDHSLYMGAQKTVKWDGDVDRLELIFDGMPIDIPEEIDAQWQPTNVSALTVTRTSTTNGIRVQLKGVFDIMAKVVPITEKDSHIHNYGVTEDDSLAHFDLGFKFYGFTDDVHGVLGQTYRPDYVNKLSVTAKMPIMGDAPSYISSNILATDCKVARFGRHAGISMITGHAN